jgi:hypothetical protein
LFEEVLGIPAHPLLVHAAVVFVPLQILAAFAYAIVPYVRRLIAWLVVALAVVAPLAALFSKLSGDAFRARLIRNGTVGQPVLDKISQHSSYGNNTLYFSIGLSVAMLALVAVQVLRSRRPATAGAAGAAAGDGEEAHKADQPAKGWIVVAAVLTVAVLVVGAFTGYYVFKTGDTGAHIVWSGL